MLRLRDAFDLPDDTVWLNCAHQGPLPRAAAEAARRAVEWKQRPWELTTERFAGVPRRLKENLARLLGTRAEQIVLANGASYGLHLLANGLPLTTGDEVLVMRDDFPSNLLPWLGLTSRGVEVRQIEAEGFVPSASEVQGALRDNTRLVCLSWVHSFSGHRVDVEGIGRLCREAGVLLVLNATQGVGARSLNLGTLPVDAVVGAGWKWLCGPYATGYLWASDPVLASLQYNQAYWLSAQTADDLGSTALPDPAGAPPARRYDIFGTANFFNFVPWNASLELLLDIGIEAIAQRDRDLVIRLCAGLERLGFDVLGPPEPGGRGTDGGASIVAFTHPEPERNEQLQRELGKADVHLALRRGRLRAAPHFYNTPEDIDRTLDALRPLV